MISVIVAFDENMLIGDGSRLPWNIPEDMKKFKQLTMGNVLIMGRKTYESIGKILPGRINIVLSKDAKYQVEGGFVCNNLSQAIKKAKNYQKEIFIVGGSEVYKQSLEIADKIYVSHILGEYNGDTYFPNVQWEKWKAVKKEKYENWEFVEYAKRNK